MRACPSAEGPVLAPPCMQQRPLVMAGPLHGQPERVLAPQRGAAFWSPRSLPFRRGPWPCGFEPMGASPLFIFCSKIGKGCEARIIFRAGAFGRFGLRHNSVPLAALAVIHEDFTLTPAAAARPRFLTARGARGTETLPMRRWRGRSSGSGNARTRYRPVSASAPTSQRPTGWCPRVGAGAGSPR